MSVHAGVTYKQCLHVAVRDAGKENYFSTRWPSAWNGTWRCMKTALFVISLPILKSGFITGQDMWATWLRWPSQASAFWCGFWSSASLLRIVVLLYGLRLTPSAFSPYSPGLCAFQEPYGCLSLLVTIPIGNTMHHRRQNGWTKSKRIIGSLPFFQQFLIIHQLKFLINGSCHNL